MSIALFPDNTVLCNFAAIRRLDLLRDFLRGRGRWTEAVAAEAESSASFLPALRTLRAEGWLADPIVVSDPSDVRAIEAVRINVFGGSVQRRTQHLGEAQTCHIIATWHQYAGAVWISDDQDSLRFADTRGIAAWETLDIMRAIASDGDLTPQAAYALMLKMADAGRALTLPRTHRGLQD